MQSDIPPSVIAVDGGGTRCRLVLDAPSERFSVEVGAANVSSDFDATIQEITVGLDKLAAAARLPVATLMGYPAYLGLAGVISRALAERVTAALSLHRARVADDRHTALRGALGVRDGAIAHFGTGSFLGVQIGGQSRLAGGWGSRLGDEGSAFWLGRKALSATLEAVDALIAPSPLTIALLERFGSPAAIVAHAAEAAPDEIASLARMVTDHAVAGDAVGQEIMQAGAAYITWILDRMGWQPDMALCLTGGVGPEYRDYLPAPYAKALIEPEGAPIDGAVALARGFAREAVS